MTLKKIINFILTLPKNAVIFLINIYQKTLSPDHGWFKARRPFGYCRFYPSCSEYSKQALNKKGLIIGLLKSIYRVLRCNPWSKGGVDMP